MDCYKILRLHPSASSADIEKASNRMMSIWNPNDYDDDYRGVALCVVDDIKKAKRILMDPIQRQKHDKELNEEVKADIHSNLKDIKIPVGNLQSVSFSETDTEPKYMQYLTSTPRNDERYEMEEFRNISDVDWNSASYKMNDYPQMNDDVLWEDIDGKEDLISNQYDDLSMRVYDLNDAMILNETKPEHETLDFKFAHFGNPVVSKDKYLRPIINKISVSPTSTQPIENSTINDFPKRVHNSTSRQESNLEIMQRTILKNHSKVTQPSNQLKSQTFEIEYSLYIPKITEYSPRFPDLYFIPKRDVHIVEDDLLNEYLKDTFKFKVNSNEPVIGIYDFKPVSFSESCTNFSERACGTRKETPSYFPNSELFNKELIMNDGLIKEMYQDCSEMIPFINNQNSSMTNYNKECNELKTETGFSEHDVSMVVNVSIESLKENTELDWKTTKKNTELKNFTGEKNISNSIFNDNRYKTLVSLDTGDKEIRTTRKEFLELPDGKILKCDSSLKAKITTQLNKKEDHHIWNGVAGSSYSEEDLSKIISAFAQLEDRKLVTKYYFNDIEERLEVFVDGILKCRLRNGSMEETKGQQDEMRISTVPFSITSKIYANGAEIITLRINEKQTELIKIYKNGQLLFEV
ncbi:hypothetical protein HNY73_020827 [Argiope bruennichi]|uniref:J domain-containing protein n=1 Tax=Argiope bruennichi TaxID=94029 RepID=A0A8T0E954_ARGBR|nr:hypothetical protein HNY73_020827 [Argiope bruennichi]